MVQQIFAWGAVGLGNDQMAGALILMVYPNMAGDNVTFSPRLASRHAEPVYYPDLQVEILAGTGIINDTFVLSALCHNCRHWPGALPGGWIDVTHSDQRSIFALGPEGDFASDDPAAPLRYHEAYGSFSIDMKAATGPAAPPVLDSSTTQQSSGAVMLSGSGGHKDWASVMHALAMIFAFAVLFPFGVVVLRWTDKVPYHAIIQGIAVVSVLVGFGLAMYISTLYNRVSRVCVKEREGGRERERGTPQAAGMHQEDPRHDGEVVAKLT